MQVHYAFLGIPDRPFYNFRASNYVDNVDRCTLRHEKTVKGSVGSLGKGRTRSETEILAYELESGNSPSLRMEYIYIYGIYLGEWYLAEKGKKRKKERKKKFRPEKVLGKRVLVAAMKLISFPCSTC